MAIDSEKSLEEISDQTQTTPETRVPAGASKAVRAFVAEHGGSASVVVQPIGRAGTRVTLVGADGVLGDQVVANNIVADALVAEIDGLTPSEWDRELISSVNPAPGHYRKMAGWVALQTRFPKARNAALEN